MTLSAAITHHSYQLLPFGCRISDEHRSHGVEDDHAGGLPGTPRRLCWRGAPLPWSAFFTVIFRLPCPCKCGSVRTGQQRRSSQRCCWKCTLTQILRPHVLQEQLPKPSTPMTQNDNPFYNAQNSTLSGPFRCATILHRHLQHHSMRAPHVGALTQSHWHTATASAGARPPCAMNCPDIRCFARLQWLHVRHEQAAGR